MKESLQTSEETTPTTAGADVEHADGIRLSRDPAGRSVEEYRDGEPLRGASPGLAGGGGATGEDAG